MNTMRGALAALIVLVLPLAAAAEGKGRGPDKPSKAGDAAEDAVEAVVHAGFTELERQIIHEFFGVGYSGGQGDLPPGLRKQLDERGTLPPGLSGRPLPPGLTDRLGPAPAGYQRIIVDDDVLLIEAATRLVVDAVLDVARGG
jgi:hypothetical protein